MKNQQRCIDRTLYSQLSVQFGSSILRILWDLLTDTNGSSLTNQNLDDDSQTTVIHNTGSAQKFVKVNEKMRLKNCKNKKSRTNQWPKLKQEQEKK